MICLLEQQTGIALRVAKRVIWPELQAGKEKEKRTLVSYLLCLCVGLLLTASLPAGIDQTDQTGELPLIPGSGRCEADQCNRKWTGL